MGRIQQTEQEMRQETKIKRKKKRSKRSAEARQNKFTMIGITCVVCLLCAILLHESSGVQQRITENAEKKEDLAAQIDEQKDRTEDIEALEEYVDSDEYVIRKAQEAFGLVQENEVVLNQEK